APTRGERTTTCDLTRRPDPRTCSPSTADDCVPGGSWSGTHRPRPPETPTDQTSNTLVGSTRSATESADPTPTQNTVPSPRPPGTPPAHSCPPAVPGIPTGTNTPSSTRYSPEGSSTPTATVPATSPGW